MTITLDDEFVRQMDAVRDGQPRGRWLEGLVEGGALMPHIPTVEQERQMAVEDRSPKVQPGYEPPREPSMPSMKSARQLLEEQRQEEAGES